MGCLGSKEPKDPAKPDPGAVDLKPTKAPAADSKPAAASNPAATKPAESKPASSPAPDEFPLKAEAVRIFNLADADKSGTIEVGELARMRGGANAQVYAKSMMRSLDLDGNGSISMDEWIAYVKSQVEKEERVRKFSSFTALKALQEFERNLIDPEAAAKGKASSGVQVVLTPNDSGEVIIDFLVQNDPLSA